MEQSLADMILHLVFRTKGRNPWIQSDVGEALLASLQRAQIPYDEKLYLGLIYIVLSGLDAFLLLPRPRSARPGL